MNFSKGEILSIVNSRRQTTTWKLECHPKMAWCQYFPKQLSPITCKSVSWSCEVWKCRNLPEGLLSEEKWRRVRCTTILFNFSPEYVQDGLRKASCKVKQSSRLPGCDFDISARQISQSRNPFDSQFETPDYHMEA